MKNQYINIIIFLIIASLLLPFFAISENEGEQTVSAVPKNTADYSADFKILNEKSGKIMKLSKEDYVRGVIFAEMSPENNEEALKAQAVAAYTLALYKKANSTGEYDLSDNYQSGQGYLSDEDAKIKFGDKFDGYKQKLDSVISSVIKYVITYENAPIMAAYHGISAGKTESCENVFGGTLPYLTAVESVGDLLSPEYLSTVTVSAIEFREAVKKAGVTFSDDISPSDYIGGDSKSPSGTVLKINLCGGELTGRQVREAFSLNSANFDVAISQDNIVFTVRGKGHGVGMSQYGANYMASLGSTFLEILSWYYPGCQMSVVTEK